MRSAYTRVLLLPLTSLYPGYTPFKRYSEIEVVQATLTGDYRFEPCASESLLLLLNPHLSLIFVLT